MNDILITDGLSVSFGGVHAVTDVSLRVASGQLVGLIGPNGAGKTTFIDALTGFVRSRGTVTFDGHDISGWPAHKRARVGLLRTWQSTEIFTDLTVSENLLIGTEKESLGRVLLDLVAPARRSPVADVRGTLKRFDLDGLAGRMPSDLSAGQRKLVGVARALAAGPRLVLMDEPAAGLDSHESLELGRHLHGVIDDGISILLIDHDMGLVLSVCDYLYVLDAGRLIAQGTPAEIRRDEQVLAAYLGESEENAALDTEVSR
jgi:branched-chain amino acid transport system ATP-binding protein